MTVGRGELTQAIGLHLLSEKFLDHVPVFGMVA